MKILDSSKLLYKVGTIVTTDAFFRTTKKEVEYYQKMGALGIEMETAGLLSVAAFNQIEIVALLTSTDSYATHSWQKPLNYEETKLKTMQTLFDVALKVVS